MNNENTFRFMVIAGFVTLTCIGLYFRVRADSGEHLDRRQEGLFILFSLRIIALIFLVGILAYMIRPSSMAWSAVPLPGWLRWIGVAAGAASMVLKAWTFQCLGKNLTDTVVTREEHELVTEGPYRWIRHPFYSSFAMDVVGISLLVANWFLMLLGAIAFALLAARTRIEERKLVDRFGARYERYMQRTGRFFPRRASR